MNKRIAVIALSIITAFIFLSAGYSLWEKELVIKGNITVNRPEAEVQVIPKLTPSIGIPGLLAPSASTAQTAEETKSVEPPACTVENTPAEGIDIDTAPASELEEGTGSVDETTPKVPSPIIEESADTEDTGVDTAPPSEPEEETSEANSDTKAEELTADTIDNTDTVESESENTTDSEPKEEIDRTEAETTVKEPPENADETADNGEDSEADDTDELQNSSVNDNENTTNSSEGQ